MTPLEELIQARENYIETMMQLNIVMMELIEPLKRLIPSDQLQALNICIYNCASASIKLGEAYKKGGVSNDNL